MGLSQSTDILAYAPAILLAVGVCYFLWIKIVRMYYRYYFYTRQGIPCVAFPVPLIGNLLYIKEGFDQIDRLKWTPIEHQWYTTIARDGRQLPPMHLCYQDSDGAIIVNDPQAVNELYVTLNKFVDKHHKLNRVFSALFGDSILLSPSNELWAEKRKHLSAAFYKDKMMPMLRMVIGQSNEMVQELIRTYAGGRDVVDVVTWTQDILVAGVMKCVFGFSIEELAQMGTIKCLVGGKTTHVTISVLIRKVLLQYQDRLARVFRSVVDFLDKANIGAAEKEAYQNALAVKDCMLQIINKRRAEMAQKDYVSKGDFLTMMLQDDLFKGNDQYMQDECLTILGAATQTTSLLASNALFYLTKQPEKRDKLRLEMRKCLEQSDVRDFKGLSNSGWCKVLLDDELMNNCNYLAQVVTETLRIDPQVRFSTPLQVTEDVQVCGKRLLKGQGVTINMYALHMNKEQWISPELFIPERFDPTSEYYLTPSGKKRHPMSYGPFLGGRRVCLGKTMAEYISRCLLAIIVGQVSFEFADRRIRDDKPPNTLFHPQPVYEMFVETY